MVVNWIGYIYFKLVIALIILSYFIHIITADASLDERILSFKEKIDDLAKTRTMKKEFKLVLDDFIADSLRSE